MRNESRQFSVLMMLQDPSLALQIKDRIRTRWPEFPIQTSVTDDPKTCLREFKDLSEQSQPLVIFNLPFPGGDPKNFITELQKMNGATTIIVLTSQMNADLGLNLIKVKLPLVNWTELLQRIEEAIPEDLKTRYGILKRNTLLLDRLKAYAVKYKEPHLEKQNLEKPEPIVCISRFFDSHLQGSGGSVTSAQSPGILQQQTAEIQTVYMEIPEALRRFVFKSETLWMGLICVATAVTYLFFNEVSGSGLFSLKGFLTGLSFFSTFGFFAGRALDRFLLAQQVKQPK